MPDFIQPQQAEQQLARSKQSFKAETTLLKDKPVKSRECHDTCCLVFFIVFFLTFVVYAAYSIRVMAVHGQFKLPQNVEGSILNGVSLEQLHTFVIVVVACLGGAIVIALTLCGVLCCRPFQGVYVMAGGSTLAVLGLAIYLCVSVGNLKQFSTYFYVVVFVFAVTVIAARPYLQKSAILIKTTKIFITNNPKIIMIVIINLIYSLIVLVLWCVGFYSFSHLYSQQILSYGGFVGSSVFWAFLLVFFNLYFYYTSIFLTTFSLAIWFYQKDDMDGFGTPFRYMIRYHLGTITFATLIVSIAKFIKFFLLMGQYRNSNAPASYVGSCFACFVTCCLGALQPLFQVLNSYAIITSALTGKSFIDSAKLIAQVAYEDFQAFVQFGFAGFIMRIGALIFSSSIPTIVGTILINTYIKNSYLTMIGSLLIMFTTSVIATVVLSLFLESIDALFIMYRLDTELTHCGVEVQWAEKFGKSLEEGFNDAFAGEIKKKPKPKYKNVTTVVVHQNGATEVYKNKVQVPENEATLQTL